MQLQIPSQIWFIHQTEYHYAVSVIYITFYLFLVLFISLYFQWKIKTLLSKNQSSFDLKQLAVAIGEDDAKHASESDSLNRVASRAPNDLQHTVSSPSSSRKVFFKEKILIDQPLSKAWCSSLMEKHNIYRIILMDLSTKALQIGVVFKLFILYYNMDSDEDQSDEHDLLRIILYISALIYIIYKLIACITVYIISHRCVDIVLELFNFTFLRCLYVNYRLYSQETSAPQKFFHLLHSSLKTSTLLLLFLTLLLHTNNKHIRYDAFIISCIALSFISLLSSIISNDANIMKRKWKSRAFDCMDCRLDVKYLCRSLLWRFSEITHRIILLLLLYISLELKIFLIILSIEYALCFILFCYNRSVLVLGSIFFYHVTAGKYFGGGHLSKQIGYYIFVTFSIYRFLSSFLYLVFLTLWHFMDFNIAETQPNSPDLTIETIVFGIIYEWITLILWILCMFYVTEKGTRAVYSDQLLVPLAIYQQFVELLDFVVFGASVKDLVKRRYDNDNKNIMQYLCSTTNKLTRHSQARLDIIRNILFINQAVYKSFLFEKNDKNQTCLHYAVTANQLNIIKFFVVSCNMDINVMDDNDQTGLHIAIERSSIETVKYFLTCPQLDIALKDTMNRTYLHFAAMSQSLQIIKCFDSVNHDRVSYNATDDWGKTMLFYAENKPVIKHLIEQHEMDINAVDFDGKTILFHSINDDKFELTKYFIEECNSDIHIQDHNGNLAFFYAQNIEMADYMMNTCNMDCNLVNYEAQSVIFNAISKHYTDDLCKYYIETCNVNINQRDKDNQSLLDIAVEHLNITQVKYLLNKRNVGSSDTDEEDIQHMIHIKTWCCAKDAAIKSLYELFELGENGEYGVDNLLKAVNNNGNIHNIHYLVQSMWYVQDNQVLLEFGIGNIYMMLMKNNRLVDIEDDEQNTPIFYCIDSEVYDLVELFVENGADLYHRNSLRESPLEYAIQKCKSADIRDYLTETQYNSPYRTMHPSGAQIQNTKSVSTLMIDDGNPNPPTVQPVVEITDIPQILLQKTIQYLTDDNDTTKRSSSTDDVDVMLEDIDVGSLVEMLDEKIEEDESNNKEKQSQNGDNDENNTDKQSQNSDMDNEDIDKQSQNVSSDDIDGILDDVDFVNMGEVLDDIDTDIDDKESEGNHQLSETIENKETNVVDEHKQNMEIATDTTTQNEIKQDIVEEDISNITQNIEHVDVSENPIETQHPSQTDHEIAPV